jgi:hypothetical protein
VDSQSVDTTSGGEQRGRDNAKNVDSRRRHIVVDSTCTDDAREFGTQKALANLPYLLKCLDHCNQRLLRWQDTIDQTTVSSGFVEKLGQPTVPEERQSVAGIHLHNLCLMMVLAVVRQFAHVITGFRNGELRAYLQRRMGRSPDEYPAAQLQYDLLKLRAKGLIRKREGQTRYVLTPQGMFQGTATVKLKECLDGTVGEALDEPPQVGSPQTRLQIKFRQVRWALLELLETVGLNPA